MSRGRLTKPKKKLLRWALLIGFVLAVFILWGISFARSGSPVTLFQAVFAKKNADGTYSVSQKNMPYDLEVDFGEVFLDEAKREKKLEVYRQKETVQHTAKKDGLFGWDVYSQTKTMIIHGVATYTVDLNEIQPSDIVADAETHTITIYIPEPVLSIEYLPEETEFLDTKNGLLRFGEMELSPEMMSEVETLAKQKLREGVENDDDSAENARRFAMLSVKEVFEPVLKAQLDAIMEAQGSISNKSYYSVQVVVGERGKIAEETETE